MATSSRRKETPQPDAEHVYAVIRRYKASEPEVAQQLEAFFDLFRGMGVPMTFSPSSLMALDEAFPALMEQLEEEVGNTNEEGEDLMLIIQLCGFWLGTIVIEELGGAWHHDSEEGSVVRGARGQEGDLAPFDPFIHKANNPRISLVKEFEELTGVPVAPTED